MDKLQLRQVIDDLRSKKVDYRDFTSTRKDVKIASDVCSATIGGKEYVVDEIGRTTLYKLLGIPKSYFNRYPVQTEVAEHANILLKAKSEESVFVRTQGDRVRAFLQPNYSIFDNDQVLESVVPIEAELLDHSVGLQKDLPSFSVYTIIYGKAKVEKDAIFPMIRLSNSEVGLSDLIVEAGLFRLVCTNGMVRHFAEFGYFRWNHGIRFADRIQASIQGSVQRGMLKWSGYQEMFENSRNKLLTRPFEVTVNELVDRGSLAGRFAKNLIEISQAQKIETVFDVVNLITSEAQKSGWNVQLKYEDVATQLLENRVVM